MVGAVQWGRWWDIRAAETQLAHDLRPGDARRSMLRKVVVSAGEIDLVQQPGKAPLVPGSGASLAARGNSRSRSGDQRSCGAQMQDSQGSAGVHAGSAGARNDYYHGLLAFHMNRDRKGATSTLIWFVVV